MRKTVEAARVVSTPTSKESSDSAVNSARPQSASTDSSQINGVHDAHVRAVFAISADSPKPTAIAAELTGVNTIVALGATTVSKTPILTLCAELVAAGIDPTMPLTVYRGSTLALTVRSIGEAANLEINGKGSGFAVRTAPLVRKNGRAGTEGGARA